MQKAHLPLYKVPPPPTTTIQPAKGVGRGRGGVAKPTTTGINKPTFGARIDTGLGRRLAGKENKPDLAKPAQRVDTLLKNELVVIFIRYCRYPCPILFFS